MRGDTTLRPGDTQESRGWLSPTLRWRAYEDGIVVHVPSTCETHLLAADLMPVFASPELGCTRHDPATAPGTDDTAGSAAPALPMCLTQAVFDQLVELRILERCSGGAD